MPRGVRDAGRVAVQDLIIRRVLKRSKRKGWDDAMTAAVIQASLRPSRVKYRVVGPCFYCGDDLADSVDHMTPLLLGGADTPENCVSACWPCNDAKGARTVLEFWRGAAKPMTRGQFRGRLDPNAWGLPREVDYWGRPV